MASLVHLSAAEVRDLLGAGAAGSPGPEGHQAVQHAIMQQLAHLRTCIMGGGDAGDATTALRSMDSTLDECATRAEAALERSAVERARMQHRRQEMQRPEPGLVAATTRTADDPHQALQASPFSSRRFSRLQAQLNDVVFDLS